MKKYLSFALLTSAALLCAENVIRNANFDYPERLNGSMMYLDDFDVGCKIISRQPQKPWRPTPFEGWWLAANPDAEPVVEAGNGSIKLSGHGYALTSSPRKIEPGTVVMSLVVRTNKASAKAVLQSMDSDGGYGRVVHGIKEIALPEDTKGETVRLQVVFPDFKGLACARIEIAEGSVEVFNVQVENAEKATAFDVRSGDKLELSLGKFKPEKFPRFWQNRSGIQQLAVTNRSTKQLKGTLRIFLDQWQNPGSTVYCEQELQGLDHGRSVLIDVNVGELPPDAYIIFAELTGPDGKVIVSKDGIFDPSQTGSGVIGKSMLSAHNVLRFGVYREQDPAKIFGVGNSMVGNLSFWTGCGPEDYVLTRKLHFVGYMSRYSEGELFNTAVGNAETYIGDYSLIAAEPGRPDLSNPSHPGELDYYNPEAYEIMMKRAEDVGRDMAAGPGYNGLKMQNEAAYLSCGGTYPTEAADKSFREWVKARYETLDAVNKAWHKEYQSWDEVEQIVSAKMVNQKTTITKTGAAAVDWMAHIGTLTDEVGKMMQDDPGRAMDWFRWRTEKSVWIYKAFHDKVKEFAPDRVVGINMAWPNFWPQIMLPMWRATDGPMLDMQYACGHSVDLGNSDEMIDILEMAESTMEGKPIWGIENYIQPTFPADFAPLQNWGMLAHGMTNNLVFGWRPYADVGYGIFTEPRVWETKNQKTPMWFMIDTDGTELPAYATNQRSVLEIEEFHKKYDGLSLKRLETKAAYYLPDDSIEFMLFSTTNRPFQSVLTSSRIGLGAHFRRAGATLRYMDDADLFKLDLDKFDTVIVPPSPVMSRPALEKLAKFAKDGGTVVFVGPCGMLDPCLNPYEEIADGVFAKGWAVPEAWKDYRNILKDLGNYSRTEIIHLDIPELPDSMKLKNAKDEVIGSVCDFGHGKIMQLNVWPYRYEFKGIQYTPEFQSAIDDLVKTIELERPVCWVGNESPEEKGYGKPGEGAPFVEVVLRKKSDSEYFLFVLNQGGAGSGTVRLAKLFRNAEDCLTGIPVLIKGNEIPISIPAFGYKVYRLTK